MAILQDCTRLFLMCGIVGRLGIIYHSKMGPVGFKIAVWLGDATVLPPGGMISLARLHAQLSSP